ncbi:MAG: lysophospholipid acyltransferase family protein, partial [Oscillospiraceae bacterium]
MSLIFRIFRFICGVWLHIKFKIDFRNNKEVEKQLDGGFIVCANHYSNADPILMAMGINRQIFFMAKEELFNKNWICGKLFYAIGAFPVSRGKGDTTAINRAFEVVEEGKLLGIFPEGTRSKDGELLRPKSGAALIAQKTKSDILPIGITYENKQKFRSKVIIHYGEIIKNSQLGFTDELSPRVLKGASVKI